MIFRNRLTGRRARAAILSLFFVAALGAGVSAQQKKRPVKSPKPAAVTPAVRAALEGVRADSLRGHLSFIASDLLEGRDTPSRGLDIAAEYVAAQFRRAGLEPAGDDGYFQTATFALRSAPDTPIKSRNVVGLLRGSDPVLKDTYVMLSAHYDHVGVREQAEGPDKIFNGANDDASGAVTVIELAGALAQLRPRPRRSILFVAFTGEEKGLQGSRFYGRHPLVPLEKTVAQVNLEHMGRTDDSEGPQVGAFGVTGFDYSSVGATLQRASEAGGVRVYKHPTNSDAFFRRSDNAALADLGVPAHTVSVSYIFPDYHGAGDHWEKIDYANMERVARALGLGLLALANDSQEPRWDEQNPKTERFVKAWRERRAK
ncbi:MAG TPA: M28 family peptidase [Pyrinomonadaceae bacterium]